MTASPAKAGEKISLKAFGQGLAAVAAIYVCVFAYVAMKADKTLQGLEEKFPFRVVLIDRPQEAYVYPPAPAPAETAQRTIAAPAAEQSQVDVPLGPLKPAPFDGLFEKGKNGGKLPKISDAGLTPFEAYKRPFSYQGNNVVVLAIRDYGLSATDSDQALALPPDITLILSPYAENRELWQKKAREAGHEVWLALPMENARFLAEDPGPDALLVHSSMPDNKNNLEKMLGSVTGYAGVVAETDKTFLDMHAMLGELVKSIFHRGLGYIEMNPIGSEFLETLAVESSSPFTNADENANIYTDTDLARLESLARQKGYVTVTLALMPKNIEAIKTWTLGLTSRGFALAPLSAAAAGRIPKRSLPRPTSEPVPPPATTPAQ